MDNTQLLINLRLLLDSMVGSSESLDVFRAQIATNIQDIELGYIGLQPGSPWRLVATHPECAAETTDRARALDRIRGFNGKLYLGYGDEHMNTGPCVLRAFDPTDGSLTPPVPFPTMKINDFRVFDGRLYAFNGDQQGGAGWMSTDGSGIWTTQRTRLWHTWGMEKIGNTFYSVGNGILTGNPSAVYAGTEGGPAHIPVHTGLSNGYFYGIGKIGSELYVQNGSKFDKFNGTAWVPQPVQSLLSGPWPYGHFEPFIGGFLMRRSITDTGEVLHMGSDAILRRISFAHNTVNYCPDGTNLYTVSSTGDIFRSANRSTTRTNLGKVFGAKSVAVLGDKLYVGAVNGRLYSRPLA